MAALAGTTVRTALAHYKDFDSLVLFTYTAAAAVRRVCLNLGHSHLYYNRATATSPPPPRRTDHRPYHWLRYQPGGL